MAWGLLDLLLQFVFRLKTYGVGNSGVSFGLGSESDLPIKVALLVLMTVFGWWLFWYSLRIDPYLFAVFVGGAVNLASRFGWGEVWDYIQLPYLLIWINLSDILIALGSISYILVTNDDQSVARDK